MKGILILLAILSCCSASYADKNQRPAVYSDTTTELLVYYDWDELLVDTPTRRPTKIKEVAENISIITADDIRTMNAHSVNEILMTLTGVNPSARTGNLGAHSAPNIHASYYEHVLLLLDGVRLNDVDAGYPETGGIPVQIIDRIEVVKGPASSAWGSALGGVINIITKQPGSGSRPTGSLYASYGKGTSQEYRADAAGSVKNLRYYLYGGSMNSDGLRDDKYFINKSFYGKFSSELTKDVSLMLTAGYWDPDLKSFDYPPSDLNYREAIENYLVTGRLSIGLTPTMRLDFDLYIRSQWWNNTYETLSNGTYLNDTIWDNSTSGGNAHLTWEKDSHSMLFGAELSKGTNDRIWRYASAPTIKLDTEKRNDWAVYFNDTITWQKLVITPGLRYDHLSIVDAGTDDIISPSLGATYKISDDTLLRATAAHGFIRPAIGLVVGNVGYAGYKDLKPEDLWSLQAGIESTHFSKTHLKADVFYHHTKDTWYWNDARELWVNGDVSERTGCELNVTMRPLEHFTAALGASYIWVEPYKEGGDALYGLNVNLNYKTESFGSLTLFGNYLWMNEHIAATGSYDDMIWDIHYNNDIFSHENSGTTVNFFISGRNLFNGEQYSINLIKNPARWFEVGLRIYF